MAYSVILLVNSRSVQATEQSVAPETKVSSQITKSQIVIIASALAVAILVAAAASLAIMAGKGINLSVLNVFSKVPFPAAVAMISAGGVVLIVDLTTFTVRAIRQRLQTEEKPENTAPVRSPRPLPPIPKDKAEEDLSTESASDDEEQPEALKRAVQELRLTDAPGTPEDWRNSVEATRLVTQALSQKKKDRSLRKTLVPGTFVPPPPPPPSSGLKPPVVSGSAPLPPTRPAPSMPVVDASTKTVTAGALSTTLDAKSDLGSRMVRKATVEADFRKATKFPARPAELGDHPAAVSARVKNATKIREATDLLRRYCETKLKDKEIKQTQKAGDINATLKVATDDGFTEIQLKDVIEWLQPYIKKLVNYIYEDPGQENRRKRVLAVKDECDEIDALIDAPSTKTGPVTKPKPELSEADKKKLASQQEILGAARSYRPYPGEQVYDLASFEPDLDEGLIKKIESLGIDVKALRNNVLAFRTKIEAVKDQPLEDADLANMLKLGNLVKADLQTIVRGTILKKAVFKGLFKELAPAKPGT